MESVSLCTTCIHLIKCLCKKKKELEDTTQPLVMDIKEAMTKLDIYACKLEDLKKPPPA